MKPVLDEKITRFINGAFSREFRWDTSSITNGSQTNSGYIVQHIIRKTRTTTGLYDDEESYNHKYWEAWPVKENKIALPDYGFDDMWTSDIPQGWDYYTTAARKDYLEELFQKRRNSAGVIFISAKVYWAPQGSDLEEIVRNTFNVKILWARDLPAAWDVPNYHVFTPLFSNSFCSYWNLDNKTTTYDVCNPFTKKS